MRTSPTTATARVCVAALTAAAALLPAAGLAAKPSSKTGADRTPPTVSITSPANGAAISPSPTVSGSAADNVAVASVSVSVDGGPAQAATGTTSWSTSLSTLAAGAHTVIARAVDGAGNSASTSVSVTVSSNATPPTSTITEPRYDGAVVSGSSTLQGGSSDGTYAVTREEWDVDGVAVATGTSPYGLSYAWDTTRVAQGGHTLTYRTWNSAGATSSASRAVTVGSATVERVAVILYNFSNQAPPTTPQTVSDWTFGTTRSVAGFYQEDSFGRLLIGGHLNAAGDVFGFYTVPYAFPTELPCDFTPWEASALQQAAADGFDANQYDVVLLTAAVPPGCGNGVATTNQDRVPWNDPQNADDWIAFAAHELGHSFGVNHHAGSWTCYDSSGTVVAVSGNCTSYEYGDPYDIMGTGNVSHMNGYELVQIGVLRSGNVQTVTTSGTYSLAPITAPSSGVQLIRVPRGWDASGTPTDYYYIEFRQPAAYEVPPPYVVDYNGVLIREAPDFFPNGLMSHLIDTTPGSITTAGQHDNFDAALLPGRSFSDAGAGVTISTVSCGGAGATVTISVAAH